MVKVESEKRDGRLPQQFGKFGESLVMFWLGQTLGYSVALVDHVGADIIASKNGKRLAVSVKSRLFRNDDPSFVFDINNNNKLRDFAGDFGCAPAVAFVFGDKDGNNMDVYLIELDIFEKCCREKAIGFSLCKDDGLGINNAVKKQEGLRNNQDIKHLRLTSGTQLYKGV
jgi:Holliday junction resolvase